MSALSMATTTNTLGHDILKDEPQETKRYYLNRKHNTVLIQTHTSLKNSNNDQQNLHYKTSKNSTIEQEKFDNQPIKPADKFHVKSDGEENNGRILPRLNKCKNEEKTIESNPKQKYKEDEFLIEKTAQTEQTNTVFQSRHLMFLENLKKNLKDKKNEEELKQKRKEEEIAKIRNEMGISNVKSRVYDFARRATQKLEPISSTKDSEISSRTYYNRNSLVTDTQNAIEEETFLSSNLIRSNKSSHSNKILKELSLKNDNFWALQTRTIQKDLGSTYTPNERFSSVEEAKSRLRNTLSVDTFQERKGLAKEQEGSFNTSILSGDESRAFQRKREDKTKAAILKNETDLTRWKKIQGIDLDTKVFIVLGGYEALKKALKERGWVENPNKRSICFDLKWTMNECDIWSDLLLDHQFVNHYPGNEHIVTKAGLCRTLKNVMKNIDPRSFYPRCYDLGNLTHMKAFIEDFKITKAESILKRFLENKEKYEGQFKAQVETALKACQRYLKSLDDGSEFGISEREWVHLSSDEISREELASKKHNTWLSKQGGSKPQSESSESQKNDEEQKKSQKSKQPKKNRNSKKDNNRKESDDEEKSSIVLGRMILAAKSVVEALGDRSAQSGLNGESNIWIVKPARLSRGRGIVCFKSLLEILDRAKQGGIWVVQKYIENPLIIQRRKFDIRQWVLVTDWNPLTVWFYEECYLRFGALDYDTSHLENRYIHLTNNSVTKYCKAEEQIEGNMWSCKEFEEYLIKISPNRDNIFLEKIKPSMKNIVFSSLLLAQKNMEVNKNCFELYGYDFMVDQDYNVWLIEVNCSPAMDYSTKVTERLVKMVLEDTAKVIVDSTMGKTKADTGLFTRIENIKNK